MKKLTIVLSFALALLTSFAQAQEFEKPKSGAVLELTETSMDLAAGGEISFDVWVNRSKKASRTKILAPKFSGSKAISFEVEADENDKNHFVVTATASADAKGKLTYIVSSSSIGYHQVKGKTVTFGIKTGKQLISKQDN